MKILGLDPGLGTTGWGLIEAQGNRLSHIANGELKTKASQPLPARLAHLAEQLEALLAEHRPDGAAVEGGVVNKNPIDAQARAARGFVLCSPPARALGGVYAARSSRSRGRTSGRKGQVHAIVARCFRACRRRARRRRCLAVAIPPGPPLASRALTQLRSSIARLPNPCLKQRRRPVLAVGGGLSVWQPRTLDALGPLGAMWCC